MSEIMYNLEDEYLVFSVLSLVKYDLMRQELTFNTEVWILKVLRAKTLHEGTTIR